MDLVILKSFEAKVASFVGESFYRLFRVGLGGVLEVEIIVFLSGYSMFMILRILVVKVSVSEVSLEFFEILGRSF